MEKKVKHHEADIKNKNIGTPGQNITNKKAQENTQKQIQANQQKKNVPLKNQPAQPAKKGGVVIKTSEPRPTPKKKK